MEQIFHETKGADKAAPYLGAAIDSIEINNSMIIGYPIPLGFIITLSAQVVTWCSIGMTSWQVFVFLCLSLVAFLVLVFMSLFLGGVLLNSLPMFPSCCIPSFQPPFFLVFFASAILSSHWSL